MYNDDKYQFTSVFIMISMDLKLEHLSDPSSGGHRYQPA